MTPLEAWRIISANLQELYKKRRSKNYKGWCAAEVEAEVICFRALKEMEERNKKNAD